MDFILISVIFLFCATCACGKDPCNNVEGYFWSDFTGEIPTYALRDINGKPIYFGQVIDTAERRIVPCKIYINDRRVYYELYKEERSATRNVKIFCTQHPEQFEWIKTNNGDIDLLTDKQLIIGGWEPTTTTYIGRARQGGYFWSDFTGEIPTYALAAGRDVNGKPIYFGQVIDPAERSIVPCKIYINDRWVYYELHKDERSATRNVKIFCTQHPEQFEWIKTNNEDIDFLTDKHLIIGGWEPTTVTYIGRAHQGGELSVGKLLTNIREGVKGLHVTTDGHGIRHTSYEVLSYNPTRCSTTVCNTTLDHKIVTNKGSQDCKQISINVYY